jgi:hypothetical protein
MLFYQLSCMGRNYLDYNGSCLFCCLIENSTMKTMNIILLVLLAPLSLFAQISKNQWLVGGSITGQFQNINDSRSSAKELRIPLSVGYFVTNKLALGIRGQYRNSVMTQEINGYYYATTITQKDRSISVGPFIRYYLLPRLNRFNLYTEACYSHGSGKLTYSSNITSGNQVSKVNLNTYNFNLAPVLIINEHISVELIAGYYLQKIENRTQSYHNFFTGLGLQIHLGKATASVKTP